MRLLRRSLPWLKGAGVAALILLGIMAVGLVIPGLRLALGRGSSRWINAITLGWNRMACWTLNLRVQVSGTPDPAARLLACNHISWLDVIALGAQSPCWFIAKEEVGTWPALGLIARGIGTLFVRRGDAAQTDATAELMAWQLRQGKRLVLFPEGTTTTGGRVLRFHSRLFQPACWAGATVQPVALIYNGPAKLRAPFVGEAEFLPHLLDILKLERIDMRISYCPALPAGLDAGKMAVAARQHVLDRLPVAPREVRPRRK